MGWLWIFAVILGVLFFMRRGGMASADTVAALLPQNPAVIDVRTVEEFQGGHVDQAINIPLSGLEQQIGKKSPEKEKPVLLYCRSGARSGAGKKSLKRLGYTKVHNLGSVARARALLNP